MDINTNILQQQATVVAPLKADGGSQPADPPVKGAADAKAAKGPGDLTQAVSQLNDHVQNIQRDLQFSIDIESGNIVVKVIDAKNEQVIRQMPTEEALRLAKDLAAQENKTVFNIFRSRV
ncbi:MAG: flagellar protein FlaG [Methylococcales bacterium]|nr:flagellar protein FlaG [Methylococcales bacterium]